MLVLAKLKLLKSSAGKPAAIFIAMMWSFIAADISWILNSSISAVNTQQLLQILIMHSNRPLYCSISYMFGARFNYKPLLLCDKSQLHVWYSTILRLSWLIIYHIGWWMLQWTGFQIQPFVVGQDGLLERFGKCCSIFARWLLCIYWKRMGNNGNVGKSAFWPV